MTMLATASELAGFMQQDLDTYSAEQALTAASAMFEAEADTKFSVTAATYTTQGYGQQEISLPRRPVVAITSVTVDGLAVTDYSAIAGDLYRIVRWGGTAAYASTVVVSYTYGYATVPDDVKHAVLELAGSLYNNPQGLWSESVDDYSVVYPGSRSGNSPGLTPMALVVASRYRIAAVA